MLGTAAQAKQWHLLVCDPAVWSRPAPAPARTEKGPRGPATVGHVYGEAGERERGMEGLTTVAGIFSKTSSPAVRGTPTQDTEGGGGVASIGPTTARTGAVHRGTVNRLPARTPPPPPGLRG